jgi:TatD DNase family protein
VTEHFDSHCHLTDTAFRDDREAVLHRAAAAGVTRAVTIASSVADARAAIALVLGSLGAADGPARPLRPRLWCTAGIHPHEAGAAASGDLQAIRELAAAHEEVVAIGETGLDYHYDNAPRPVQRRLFDAHLALASELALPIVVHAREADADIAAALSGMPRGVTGVLHCFTGGTRAFERASAAGWYVSFSGIASFGSFAAADLLREVPGDRLLVETDAPYLAPHPVRGRRNEPANVVHVAGAVARHLGIDGREVARRATENACRLYGVA